MTTIGDITDRISTWNPSKAPVASTFHYIDLGAVDNGTKEVTEPTLISSAEAPSRARQLVAAGDVLVSTVRPNLNAVAVVPPALDGATASTGFAVLRPTGKVLGRYLFHWVRSAGFIADMVRKATGASYPAVSDRIVKMSPLPLPPLDEQRRIAAILDQTDALRAKRRQAVAHLDDLTESLFLDMFGDPVHSKRLVRLGDVASVQIGPFGSLLHAEDYVTGGVPLINPMHIRRGRVVLDPEFSVTPDKAASLDAYRLRAGDVVMGRRGEMGRCAVVEDEQGGSLCGTGSIIVRPGPDVTATYLQKALSHPSAKRALERRSLGATLPNLNATIVNDFVLAMPPMHEQERFARALDQVGSQASNFDAAGRLLDHLAESTRVRAFSGQL